MSRFMLLTVALVLAAFSGCLSKGPLEFDEGHEEDFQFEWFPPVGSTDILIHVELRIGDGTECGIKRGASGGFDDESKIGGYFHERTDKNYSFHGSTMFVYPSLHAGPISTVPVTNLAHGALPGSFSWGLFGGWIEVNSTIYHGTFGFRDIHADHDEPLFAVDCDSPDAVMRFYSTEQFQPINSDTADGGYGASINMLVPTLPSVHLNVADRYVVEADADLVILDLLDSASSQEVAYAQSRLHLTTPDGEEELSYELATDRWAYQGFWDEAGVYELEINRFGLYQRPLVGVFGSLHLIADKDSQESVATI